MNSETQKRLEKHAFVLSEETIIPFELVKMVIEGRIFLEAKTEHGILVHSKFEYQLQNYAEWLLEKYKKSLTEEEKALEQFLSQFKQ